MQVSSLNQEDFSSSFSLMLQIMCVSWKIFCSNQPLSLFYLSLELFSSKFIPIKPLDLNPCQKEKILKVTQGKGKKVMRFLIPPKITFRKNNLILIVSKESSTILSNKMKINSYGEKTFFPFTNSQPLFKITFKSRRIVIRVQRLKIKIVIKEKC